MEVWSLERRGRMIEGNILKGFNEPRVVFPGGTRAEKQVPSHHQAEEGFYLTSRRLLSPPTLKSRQTLNKQLKATRAARAQRRGNGTVSPLSADKTARALAASPPAGTPRPEE